MTTILVDKTKLANKTPKLVNKTKLINTSTCLLVDKYRPKNIDSIIQQNDAKKIFKKIIETKEMPHLILFGPPGTGKTSIIFALAYELYGVKNIHDRVLELNASDDRGINVVRSNIKTFTKMNLHNNDTTLIMPSFKLIILDEADAMTVEAQNALRRLIETSSNNTRFCFICNYIDKIIQPIMSRCVIIRFKSIELINIQNKLTFIAKKECINIDDKALNLISTMAEGDIRKGIVILQYIRYINKIKPIIQLKDIKYIDTNIEDNIIIKIINICKNGDINLMNNCAIDIKRNVYSINELLNKLMLNIMISKLTPKQKADIILEISNVENKILDGADEYLQILNIFIFINYIFNNKQ